MQKCLKLVLIGLITLSQSLLSVRMAIAQYDADFQYAQSESSVDVEPPLIEHDVVDKADASIRQTFVATVVDDQDLDSVQLYYRFTGESSYSRYVMMRVSFSSSYIAQIPTDPNDLSSIEYYIQARDTSGNRTVRGYTFSPLVRQIVPVTPDTQAASGNPSAQPGSTDAVGQQAGAKASGFTMRKALYVVGGVLLLGLLAGASGSSGGSSGESSGGDCDASGCLLTVTVDRPTQ